MSLKQFDVAGQKVLLVGAGRGIACGGRAADDRLHRARYGRREGHPDAGAGRLVRGDLNRGERLFVVIAYIPKATVQAAIGGGALATMRMAGMDTGPGEIILAVAVLSILLTARLGAWATAIAGELWLVVARPSVNDAHDAAIESSAVEK